MIFIDSEFKGLIPALREEEFQQLENNIVNEGCRDALVVWNDILIDGHNRYDICTRNNIEFKTVDIDFEDREAVKKWIILNQFGRRNISAYDRSLLALKLKDMFSEKAKINLSLSGGDRKSNNRKTGCQIPDKAIDTKKELAKIAGVSHDTIAKVQKIEEKATEEQKEKIKKGQETINSIYKEIKKEEINKEILHKRQEEVKILPVIYNLINGNSLAELNKLKDKSIDCVITDPPYGINYVSNHRKIESGVAKLIKSDNPGEAFGLWEDICKILVNKMKHNSHLYVFTSWKVFHIFREITEKYFTIKNCLIWEKNNWSMGDLNGNYAEQYEMIIFATNGNRDLIGKREPNILHFNRVPNNKLTHSCEKPVELLEVLINKSTIEGELVADPFAGSGSTLKAAKNLNRQWWGCEIDEQHYKTALGKLA
jgi:DNA modification methylase